MIFPIVCYNFSSSGGKKAEIIRTRCITFKYFKIPNTRETLSLKSSLKGQKQCKSFKNSFCRAFENFPFIIKLLKFSFDHFSFDRFFNLKTWQKADLVPLRHVGFSSKIPRPPLDNFCEAHWNLSPKSKDVRSESSATDINSVIALPVSCNTHTEFKEKMKKGLLQVSRPLMV